MVVLTSNSATPLVGCLERIADPLNALQDVAFQRIAVGCVRIDVHAHPQANGFLFRVRELLEEAEFDL